MRKAPFLIFVTAILACFLALSACESPHTHTITEIEATEPTCTEGGVKHHWTCTECGMLFSDAEGTEEIDESEVSIPAKGHTEEIIPGTPNTCTEDGISDGKRCTVCQAILVEQGIIPAAHTPTAWIIDKPATCQSKGARHKSCTVCGEILQNEIIPSPAHLETDWIIDSAATCKDEGSRHKECITCGSVIATDAIPTVPHTFSAWHTDSDPTCLDNGSESRTCQVCSTVDTNVIPATGHTPAPDWIIDSEPNCKDKGQKHKICLTCGEIAESEAIPTTEHDYTAWSTVTPATCEAEGLERRTCKSCETPDERILAPLGHLNLTDWTIDSEPTCTADGARHRSCLSCGSTIDEDVIPALGHDFSAWTPVTAPSCEVKGRDSRTCGRCGVSEGRDVPETGHDYVRGEWVWSDNYATAYLQIICRNDSAHNHSSNATITSRTTSPTCQKEGITYYTAVAEFDGMPVSDNKEKVSAEKIDHSYEYRYDKTGHWLACTMCNAMLGGAKFEHNYSELSFDNVCTECGFRLSDEDTDFTYRLSDDENYYIITGRGTVISSDIEIPRTYKNLEVKSIADGAFYGCSFIQTLKIPSSIEYIGENAFGEILSEISVDVSAGSLSVITGILDNTVFTQPITKLKLDISSLGDEINNRTLSFGYSINELEIIGRQNKVYSNLSLNISACTVKLTDLSISSSSDSHALRFNNFVNLTVNNINITKTDNNGYSALYFFNDSTLKVIGNNILVGGNASSSKTGGAGITAEKKLTVINHESTEDATLRCTGGTSTNDTKIGGSGIVADDLLLTDKITVFATGGASYLDNVGGSGILVHNKLEIRESAIVTAHGGDGVNGANGVNSRPSSAIRSTRGEAGGNGGVGIIAEATMALYNNASVTAIGGNGGTGGNGGNGYNLVEYTLGERYLYYREGRDGGNGGNGGNGINVATFTASNTSTLTAIGGNGGNGGTGGNGSTVYNSTTIITDPSRDSRKGGSGGDGGNGGNAGEGMYVTSSVRFYNGTSASLRGGNGANGAAGGNGADGQDGSRDNSGDFRHGAPGGNGGKGGSGGWGGYGLYAAENVSANNGGSVIINAGSSANGAKGGNGGNGGNGKSTNSKNANGGDGGNGRNGGDAYGAVAGSNLQFSGAGSTTVNSGSAGSVGSRGTGGSGGKESGLVPGKNGSAGSNGSNGSLRTR